MTLDTLVTDNRQEVESRDQLASVCYQSGGRSAAMFHADYKESPMRNVFVALLMLAMTVPAVAAEKSEKPDAGEAEILISEPGRAMLTRVIEVTARIDAIDKATRTLTLMAPNNQVIKHVADEEVRNFDQIHVGDMVVATILRSLHLELVKEGAMGEGEAAGAMARAEKGEKPGAAVGGQVIFMTEVVKVDQPNNTISLKGPDGEVVAFDVMNPVQFEVVKEGDKVQATYTEAIAVEVRSAN